ncbi:MAG TPA: MoaD/ThiS family protein [Gemmatimonadaceae bacterium]|jgi:molybdopterin converting factor subunit 1
MNLAVRVFASYADIIGSDRTTVTVPEPATVGGVRAAVAALYPALPAHPIIAVNETYATDDVAIMEGDEVAVIPPVAGG